MQFLKSRLSRRLIETLVPKPITKFLINQFLIKRLLHTNNYIFQMYDMDENVTNCSTTFFALEIKF